jgi:hypothetical protein
MTVDGRWPMADEISYVGDPSLLSLLVGCTTAGDARRHSCSSRHGILYHSLTFLSRALDIHGNGQRHSRSSSITKQPNSRQRQGKKWYCLC